MLKDNLKSLRKNKGLSQRLLMNNYLKNKSKKEIYLLIL